MTCVIKFQKKKKKKKLLIFTLNKNFQMGAGVGKQQTLLLNEHSSQANVKKRRCICG